MYYFHINNGTESRLYKLLKSKNVSALKVYLEEVNGKVITQEIKLPLLRLALEIDDDNSEMFNLLFNRLMVIDQHTILQLLNLSKYQIKVSEYDFLKYFYANSYSSSINLLEKDYKDETIFDYAFGHLKIEAAKILITYFFVNSLNVSNREELIQQLYSIFMKNIPIFLSLKVSPSDIIYMYSLFINNGVDINTPDIFKETLIHKVLKNETCPYDHKKSLIKYALSHHQSIFNKSNSGETALSLAFMNDPRFLDLFFTNNYTVQELIQHHLDIYLYLYYNGRMMDVDSNNNNTSNMEIDNSVDIPALVVRVDETLVNNNFYDILKNNQELDVDILLILSILYSANSTVIRKAFIDNPDIFRVLKGNNDWQALNCACQQGDIDMVIALLKINANLSLKNNQKNTSLIIACKSASVDIVRLLLDSFGISKEDKNSSLLLSCKKNHIELVKILLGHGADVNATDIKNKTPLIIACENNNLELVRILLEAKANIEKKDELGNSSLIAAVHNMNLTMMEELLKHGANVNIFDDKRRNSLIWACLKKNRDMVQFLLQYPININYKCFNGNTPLIITCFTDQLDVAQDLLSQPSIQINETNNRKNTALITAAECGNLQIVQDLVLKKASLNLKNKFGNTALMAAIEKDNVDVAEFLLNQKVDITVKNKNGETALFIACRRNHQKLIEQLIEQGADLNGKNSNLKSVLMQACENRNMPLIEYLIQHQADVNKTYGMWNETAFMASCKCDDIAIMKLLLNYNIDVNLTSWYGKNSLMYLCENGLCEQAELIINQIKDVNTRDRNNNTALSLACLNSHFSCMTLLVEHGAELDFKNSDGNTPLHIACQNGDVDIIRMLSEHQVKLNEQNKEGDTPLLIAARREDKDTLMTLLSNPPYTINFGVMNNKGENILELILHQNNLDKLKMLLQYDVEQRYLVPSIEEFLDQNFNTLQDTFYNSNLSSIDIIKVMFDYLSSDPNYKFGEKLLLVFVKLDLWEAVQYIFDHEDYNVNYIDPTSGLSPIMIASYNGNAVMVDRLIKKGANINQISPEGGETPLMIACSNGYDKVVRTLLNHHPEVNEVNEHEETALCLASKCDNTYCAEMLLMCYADPNLCDQEGNSPLFYACRNRNLVLVEALLKYNANPGIKNGNGDTPLMEACIHGSDELVKRLQKTGININEVNNYENSALILACIYKHYAVVNTLLYYNADVFIINSNGVKALDFAKTDSRLEMIFHSYF